MKKFAIFLFTVFCFCQSVPSLAAGKILFSDDFKSMDNWTIANGNWETKDGIAEGDVGLAFAGSKDWTDYSFEVTVRSLGSTNVTTPWLKNYIFFRRQDGSNFYRYGIHGDAQSIDLCKCVNNEWSTIITYPFSAVKDKWYKFKIEAIGERIKGYVNDKLIIDVKDQTFLQGSIGIGCADDKMVSSYKDLKITELDPKSDPSLYAPEVSLAQYQSIKKEVVVNVAVLKAAIKTFSDPRLKADLVDQNGKIAKTNTISGFDADGKMSLPISVADVTPGDYEVHISLSDKGKVITSSVEKVKVLDLSWETSKAGITDEVLSPWTPLVMKDLKIRSWGRMYDFSKSFLPCAIETAGKSILSSPIAFNLSVDGNDVALSGIKPTLVNKSDAKITLKADTSTANVDISANVTIEYDGMIRIDLNFNPKKEAIINNMILEIPIKKESAELFYSMFYDRRLYGTIGDKTRKFPFWPYIWIGTDDLGMGWFTDSGKYWSNKKPASAIELRPGEETFMLKIIFIDKPLTIDKSTTYTFGMQATPVKSFDKNWRKWHYIHHAYYGMEKPPAPGKPSLLERLKKQGVNTIVYHESWTDIQNYPETSHEEQLKSLVEACHKLDMKILVYFGYEISDLAPEFAAVKDEVLVKRVDQKFSNWIYSGRGTSQSGYMVCYNSPWADFIATGIEHVMDKYKLDGVYLDSTSVPWPCPNELHGCGYRDENGKLYETWNIFPVRELMKRIYTICAKRGGFVNAHIQEADITPILGFTTSFWDAEAYQDPLGACKDEEDFLKITPLEMYRVLFTGQKMGIPSEVIVYPKGKWSFEAGLAIAMLHDVPVRPFVNNSGKIFKVWKIWDDFGVDDKNCTFLPYWKNQNYVKVATEGSYVSIYSKPGNSALVVISNLTNQEQDVNVTLNLKKLGLKNPKVSDAFTGEDIELQKNKDILIPISKFKYKLLIVKSDTK